MVEKEKAKDINLKVEKKTFKWLDEETQKKWEEFVNEMKQAEKKDKKGEIQEKVSVFTKSSKECLKIVKNTIAKEFTTIDDKKIQTYIDVKNAFEEDMQALNISDPGITEIIQEIGKWIDLKQIDTGNFPKARLEELQAFAQEKEIPMSKLDTKIVNIKTIESTNQKKTAEDILASNRNETTATEFFETSQKDNFEATMNYLIDTEHILENTDLLAFISTNSTLKNNVDNFVALTKTYLWAEKVKSLKIGKASDKFWSKFPAGTLLIQYDATTDKEKYATRWTNEYLQKLIAQKAIPNKPEGGYDISGFHSVDRTNTEKWIYAFNDDNGNFWAFERFIAEKGKDWSYMTNNLPQIIDQINKYDIVKSITYEEDSEWKYIKEKDKYNLATTDELASNTQKYTQNKETRSGLTETEIRNWYANVLTDYMMTHSDLMSVYITHLTVENINILWGDKETRTKNYHRLFFSDVEKNILRPEIDNLLNKLKPEEKKALLLQLADVKNLIADIDKKTIGETIEQTFDNLLDALGPMLFSILKFLGIGKRWFLIMFPSLKDKIDSIYKEEYGLSKEKIAAINGIVEAKDSSGDIFIFSADEIKDGINTVVFDNGKDIQKQFNKKQKTYIDLIMWDAKHYKEININVFAKWLDTYNNITFKKDTTKYKKIEDVINKKTDKEKDITDKNTTTESIDSIEDPDLFKKIMETILNSDDTRARIAKANEEIKTPITTDTDSWKYNDQWLVKGQDTDRYLISSEQSIARYLTAGLFSDKDLSYVMTENKLHNWGYITETPLTPPVTIETDTKPEEAKSTLTFKDEFAPGWVVNTAGAKKMIHEVIDMDKTPATKIKITRKNWTTIVNWELKTDYNDATDKNFSKWITYVDDKWKRVKTYDGDKIEAVGETAEVTINTKRESINTEIKKVKPEEQTIAELKDKNTYQEQLGQLSNLFTDKKTYDNLISEISQPTLNALAKDNMSHLKNMFTFWNLQKTAKNKTYTDILWENITTEQLKDIDTTKQTFTIKEAKDKKIIIEVKKNSTDNSNIAKEWTITLSKDASEKLTTKREETKVVAVK